MKRFIASTLIVIASATYVVAQGSGGNSLVIIDRGLPALNILAKQINPASKIVYLDKSENPLVAISKILKANAPINDLHILSHGKPGQLIFSGTEVSGNYLEKNEELIGIWRDSFDENGDILIYGCEVAKGYTGIEFIRSLAVFTGLDIAASDNLTGTYTQGGDWYLEVKSGTIETRLAVGKGIIEQYPTVFSPSSDR